MHGLQRGVDLVSMDCENCEYGIGHFLILNTVYRVVLCVLVCCVYPYRRVYLFY